MKQHLTSSQIAMRMAGERTPGEEQHLSECSECRAEVAGLETAVSLFRGSVREWSAIAPCPKPRQTERLAHPARWVLIAAALVILAGLPIYRNVERHRVAERAHADALLLEQVDAELSRAVPAPMEPLLKLVPGELR